MNNMIVPVAKKFVSENEVLQIQPCICTEKAEWKETISAFCECAAKIFGVNFTEGEGGIHVICDESIEKEAYIVDVKDAVYVYASDKQGCSYAMATVLQMMKDELKIVKARVEDKPDKDYRGLMVDLAREWHPFEKLFHIVDICFFYKIKYLHLHFMDDQGYTLPSKVFPKLPTENKSYTFEEIETLCAYAKSRGVVIIPEIEMPGHAKSLVDAYPELFGNAFDTEQGADVRSEAGAVITRESVICAGSEKTFECLTKLIDEVMEMFADAPYIHLGADEVNTAAWKLCSVCREYIKEHQLKDEEDLYADFLARVTNYVLSKGKRPIVWEGFAKEYNDKISKDVIVIGWENHYQYTDDLYEAGFDLINCAWKPLYLVPTRLVSKPTGWTEVDILNWNVYEWQHWWQHSVATLNPIRLEPTDKVLGAQLCVWEMTYESEIAALVVRLAALSERTWSVKRYCTEQEFWAKLSPQMKKIFKMIIQ